jgi:hypothetical protein
MTRLAETGAAGRPPSWLAAIRPDATARVRPAPVLPAAVLAATGLGWGLVVVAGARWLSGWWVVLAALAGIGGLALAARGKPLVALVPVVLAGVAWGMATGDRATSGDLLPEFSALVGWNLAFAVLLLVAYGAAVWVDARRYEYDRVRGAAWGTRWVDRAPGEPEPVGDVERELSLLEAIPSARFVALPDGGYLVVAGRRLVVVRMTVWPAGEYTLAGVEVSRDGRQYAPGTDDVEGVAADVRTWAERVDGAGAQSRGFLVVHPASARPSDEVLLDQAPQATVTAVRAEDFVETVGGFLAAEPLRLDVAVLTQIVRDGAP